MVRYVAASNYSAARLADQVRYVAANHDAVALAAQPTVAVPVASARMVDQLRQIMPMVQLQLGEDDLRLLADGQPVTRRRCGSGSAVDGPGTDGRRAAGVRGLRRHGDGAGRPGPAGASATL